VTRQSWRFPDLAEAIWHFVPEALETLETLYGRPHSGFPRDMAQWQRIDKNDEEFREDPFPNGWLWQYERAFWKGSEKLRELPSWSHFAQLVDSNDALNRRIRAVYGLVYDRFDAVESSLYLFLQDVILGPLIDKSRSFRFDEAELAIIYGEAEQCLALPRITCKTFVSIRNCWTSRAVDLGAGVVLRQMAYDEISNALRLWIVHPGFRPDDHQMCIIHEKSTVLDDSMIQNPRYEDILRQASAPEALMKYADRTVVALNLFCDNGAAEISTSWHVIKLELNSITIVDERYSTTIRSDYRLACVETEEDLSNFRNLTSGLSKNAIWKRLSVSLMRFSNAMCRTSDEEAIVDLAISAESLFGSSFVGDATHRISLNAALFIDQENWASSEVRRFFREVYRVRSAIVHGAAQVKRDAGAQSERKEIRNKLESAMRGALLKAISELSRDPQAIDWDVKLSAALDRLQNLRHNTDSHHAPPW
jgi:hypothetical protein